MRASETTLKTSDPKRCPQLPLRLGNKHSVSLVLLRHLRVALHSLHTHVYLPTFMCADPDAYPLHVHRGSRITSAFEGDLRLRLSMDKQSTIKIPLHLTYMSIVESTMYFGAVVFDMALV